MSDDTEDQIHPATPARQETARRAGEFTKSFELSAAIQMLGALLVAYLFFGPLASWVRQSTIEVWSQPQTVITYQVADFSRQIPSLLFSGLGVLAPIALLLFGIGVLSHWCQTGPVFLANKPAPDIGRLSPTQGFSRLFSLNTLSILLVGLPKSVLAIVVMISSGWMYRNQFFELGQMPVDQMIVALFELVLLIGSYVALTMLVGSMLDYGCKYVSFQKRLMMTDQQLRDELRMQNGSPRPRR